MRHGRQNRALPGSIPRWCRSQSKCWRCSRQILPPKARAGELDVGRIAATRRRHRMNPATGRAGCHKGDQRKGGAASLAGRCQTFSERSLPEDTTMGGRHKLHQLPTLGEWSLPRRMTATTRSHLTNSFRTVPEGRRFQCRKASHASAHEKRGGDCSPPAACQRHFSVSSRYARPGPLQPLP
jgi:hypothetical protein